MRTAADMVLATSVGWLATSSPNLRSEGKSNYFEISVSRSGYLICSQVQACRHQDGDPFQGASRRTLQGPQRQALLQGSRHLYGAIESVITKLTKV